MYKVVFLRSIMCQWREIWRIARIVFYSNNALSLRNLTSLREKKQDGCGHVANFEILSNRIYRANPHGTQNDAKLNNQTGHNDSPDRRLVVSLSLNCSL